MATPEPRHRALQQAITETADLQHQALQEHRTGEASSCTRQRLASAVAYRAFLARYEPLLLPPGFF